jgi:hypothetical protein
MRSFGNRRGINLGKVNLIMIGGAAKDGGLSEVPRKEEDHSFARRFEYRCVVFRLTQGDRFDFHMFLAATWNAHETAEIPGSGWKV